MNALEELLELLTCNDFESDEISEMAERIQNAPNDPEYEWVAGAFGPGGTIVPDLFMREALTVELDDYIAHGDKLDVMHEQIEEMFEESEDPLPPFPYGEGYDEYWVWLDEQLAQRGDYAFLNVSPGINDEIYGVVVLLEDVDRILELSSQLGITIRRPKDQYW